MDKRSIFFVLAVTTAFLVIKAFFPDQPQKPIIQAQEMVSTPIQKAKEETSLNTPISNNSYYILESPYQQIVFSSLGGSITEINLPFNSQKYPKSAVRPIEFDRKLITQSPPDAMFPLVEAKLFNGKFLKPEISGFYPLLRRTKETEETLQHASCALVSPYSEFSSIPYHVTHFTENEIVFEADQSHRHIIKSYSFPKEINKFPYCLNVDITVKGDKKDIWLTSGIPEVEWISGGNGAILKWRLVRGDKGTVEKIDLPKTSFQSSTIQPDWVCNSNGFFGIIVDPLQGNGPGVSFNNISGSFLPTRLQHIDKDQGRFNPQDLPGFEAKIPLDPKQDTLSLRLFAGPLDSSILTTIDNNEFKETQKPTSYKETQTFHGWFAFISEPFAKFLFFIMKNLYKLTDSWVISIILATVVLRILMYPLNRWSMRSMKAMQEVGPLVKQIQEKNKKNPKKAQMEIMALYRERKVNPFSGCLPLLIQMPFLIGMFDLLKSSVELRGTPFITGWINDLSSPDVLFEWNFHIPLIGNQFHLLPLLLGATMWWQQNLSANLPKNMNEWTDQQRQQRLMGNIMTLVMAVMFYNFPSGLNIYWISSMLLGILQQWWTTRGKKVKA